MAITVIKQPSILSAVYSNDNILKVSEIGSVYFDIVFTGDVLGTFRIHSNNSGEAEINIRYIIENFIESHIVNKTDLVIEDGILIYNIGITSNISSTVNITGLKVYNGTKQLWDTSTISVGDIINNIDSSNTIKVLSGEELTIQKMNTNSITVIDATTTIDTVVEGVNIKVVEPDVRYEPYRFAYINQNGGTDYITFTKADRESDSIKRDYYSNGNIDNLYNSEIDKTFSVYSDYMTEEQSKILKYLWISPKVVHIKNGVKLPINIQNKSINVLRRREKGMIRYLIKFKYAQKYNIQK